MSILGKKSATFCFVVLSYGKRWGCVSEHGENSYDDCYNTFAPEDTTALSGAELCQ